MEFSNEGVTAYFQIIMSPEGFAIQLENIVFENPSDDDTNTRILMQALDDARIQNIRAH